MKKTFIDLSHMIEDGTITYKGLPAPIICDYLSREASKEIYEEDTQFQIGKIEMVSNTGTYIDTPFHRYEEGKDLSQIAINAVAGLDGIVIRVDEAVKVIDESFFDGKDLRHKAVLIHTGWSKYWNTDNYFVDHPYLTAGAADYLLNNGAALVGIDSMNIDCTQGKSRPVHSILLKHEIPIVEHMCNLESLPTIGFIFYAIPPKIKQMGTFPVRAFAELRDNND
ncbi:cyclase family protein [Caldalkalibacillus salinus]|uniref:cyclase family protein n=1 Tax=Caldalkalibacillus salinus TaxID=2803787 RepID=UPI001924B9F4|nr:cyclase family protein [Caldalkalibacillus salinus]